MSKYQREPHTQPTKKFRGGGGRVPVTEPCDLTQSNTTKVVYKRVCIPFITNPTNDVTNATNHRNVLLLVQN